MPDEDRKEAAIVSPSMGAYVAMVKLLVEHPEQRRDAFLKRRHPASGLFRFLTPDGCPAIIREGMHAGCPLMVAGGKHHGWSPFITAAVRGPDLRLPVFGKLDTGNEFREPRLVCEGPLPRDAEALEERHLMWIAQLQREMDQTIRDMGWRHLHRFACERDWEKDWWAVPIDGEGTACEEDDGFGWKDPGEE